MTFLDDINPLKALEAAAEENRLTDKANWVTATANQRILMETPSPEARITLGFPTETFGYPGLSMYAKHYFFVDVGGRSRLQFGMPVTWVAQRQWYQYAGRDIAIGGGANAIFAVANRFIVSAGGGYGASPIAQTGEILPDGTWNTTDMNEILDATHWGLRAFDDEAGKLARAHQRRLGYRVADEPLVPEAPMGKLNRFVAFLGGATPDPTANSARLARLLDLKKNALLNILEKTSRIMDAVTKTMSRPDTFPIAGAVFEKLNLVKDANGALRELMTAPQIATVSKGLGTWQGDTFVDALSGWLAIFNDFATHITRVKIAVKELLVAVAKFFGVVAPDPSVLGLVGRDGVSIVTHDDVFAWAPNGFRFVGARNAKDYPVDPVTWGLRQLQAKEAKLKAALGEHLGNFAFGKSGAEKGSDASFRVQMDNEIELRAGGDVTLSTLGPEGRLRAEGSLAAEVVATRTLGLAARSGVVEVMGREVSIGTPSASDVKKAAKEHASPMVAAEEALVARMRAAYETKAAEAIAAETELATARRERAIARDAYWQFKDDPMSYLPGSVLQRRLLEADLALIRAEPKAELAKGVAEGALALLTKAERKLDAARDSAGAAITVSRTASTMDWKAAHQAVAQKVGVNARDEVAVYSGGTLSIEAGKSLEIKAENLQTPVDKATIKVEKEIELQVGAFKVTISKEKVVVNNGAADVLIIDAEGGTLQTPTGAKIVAKGADATMDATGNAKIIAAGRVLLG